MSRDTNHTGRSSKNTLRHSDGTIGVSTKPKNTAKKRASITFSCAKPMTGLLDEAMDESKRARKIDRKVIETPCGDGYTQVFDLRTGRLYYLWC